MAVLIYVLESWLIAVLGLAWLSVRSMYPTRSLLEEFLLYSQLGLATVNAVMQGFAHKHVRLCRSFFALNLVHWLTAVCCTVDSFCELSVVDFHVPLRPMAAGSPSTTTQPIKCCPNSDLAQWNRKIYFGGVCASLFLLPMSVTLALQTVHLVLAAAALVNTQPSLWPGGSSLGYLLLGYAGMLMTLKFMNFFAGPCPDADLSVLWGLVVFKTYWVLGLFSAGFVLMGTVSNFIGSLGLHRLHFLWNLFGLAAATAYMLMLYFYLWDRNVVSVPWLALFGAGALSLVFSLFEGDDMKQAMLMRHGGGAASYTEEDASSANTRPKLLALGQQEQSAYYSQRSSSNRHSGGSNSRSTNNDTHSTTNIFRRAQSSSSSSALSSSSSSQSPSSSLLSPFANAVATRARFVLPIQAMLAPTRTRSGSTLTASAATSAAAASNNNSNNNNHNNNIAINIKRD